MPAIPHSPQCLPHSQSLPPFPLSPELPSVCPIITCQGILSLCPCQQPAGPPPALQPAFSLPSHTTAAHACVLLHNKNKTAFSFCNRHTKRTLFMMTIAVKPVEKQYKRTKKNWVGWSENKLSSHASILCPILAWVEDELHVLVQLMVHVHFDPRIPKTTALGRSSRAE